MNLTTEKKKAAALFRIRKMKAQAAAMKKTLCLREQKQAFQAWQKAQKDAKDFELARNESAGTAMRDICAKPAVSRTDLELEYASFSWKTEQLKELREIIGKKAEEHTKEVEKTRQARAEHLRSENKADQASRMHDKAKQACIHQLLHNESEENEEVATTRHILKSAK